MVKSSGKLRLHRETVRALAERDLDDRDLRRAAGGVVTSCIQPNCCGDAIPE